MRLSVFGAARPWYALLAAALLAGCSNDTTAPDPDHTASASITADASASTAFVALGAQPRIVTGPDTTSATAWDIGFNATTVVLNTAGGVKGYCLCANENATDAAVMAMTADAQLPAFTNVDASVIPAESSFSDDVFTAHRWYRYNLTGTDHQIWPTFNVYLVKRGTTVYKIQITSYYGVTGTSRQITLRSSLLRN